MNLSNERSFLSCPRTNNALSSDSQSSEKHNWREYYRRRACVYYHSFVWWLVNSGAHKHNFESHVGSIYYRFKIYLIADLSIELHSKDTYRTEHMAHNVETGRPGIPGSLLLWPPVIPAGSSAQQCESGVLIFNVFWIDFMSLGSMLVSFWWPFGTGTPSSGHPWVVEHAIQNMISFQLLFWQR